MAPYINDLKCNQVNIFRAPLSGCERKTTNVSHVIVTFMKEREVRSIGDQWA